jgi:hypothetical protein
MVSHHRGERWFAGGGKSCKAPTGTLRRLYDGRHDKRSDVSRAQDSFGSASCSRLPPVLTQVE